MNEYGLNTAPYGVRGMGAYGLPVRQPMAPQVPAPYVAAPLPPVYAPALRLPAMRRMASPILSEMAGAVRHIAHIVPFPVVQRTADALDTAAKQTNTPEERPVTLEDITRWQRRAESSGKYNALNRESAGNTASGAYQYTDSTWNGYGGYKKALYAPPEVQDRRFAEDIAARYHKYGGDPFKVIAAHYLPAFADNPEIWNHTIQVKGHTVRPIATYVRHVIKGTPLEAKFDEYLAANSR